MTKTKLEESQLVLCTVTKIIGTTVFAELDDYKIEGTITFPEIAPGRIRNIREYAFPGKKIVCKVLSIKPQVIELSFRRVKLNERNEFNDRYRKERNYIAMLKKMLGEKAETIIAKIKEEADSVLDFIESSKDNPKQLEKYLSKEESERILAAIGEKKIRETIIHKKFTLSSKASAGINQVKKAIE